MKYLAEILQHEWRTEKHKLCDIELGDDGEFKLSERDGAQLLECKLFLRKPEDGYFAGEDLKNRTVRLWVTKSEIGIEVGNVPTGDGEIISLERVE